MADWDWLKKKEDLIPMLIVHDRTAADEDGDDPKDAIIFPNPLVSEQSSSEDIENLITRSVNLIGQIMGYVAKLRQEICESYPAIIQLENHKFALKHIGKYTLILRGTRHYPDTTLTQELNYIYEILCSFYGGFQTAEIATKRIPQQDNPDPRNIQQYLPAIIRTLSESLLSSQSRMAGNSFNPIIVKKSISMNCKVNHRVSLLLQSYCSRYDVLGGLVVYDSQVLCVRKLDKSMVDIISLSLLPEAHKLGINLDFPLDNVSVKRFPRPQIRTSSGEQFYLILFGHALIDFSLALLVKTTACEKDTDSAIVTQWQSPCMHIKNELFKLNAEASNSPLYKASENQPMLRRESNSGVWSGAANHLINKEPDPQSDWMTPMAVITDIMADNPSFRKVTLSHYTDSTTLTIGESNATGQRYKTERIVTLSKAP